MSKLPILMYHKVSVDKSHGLTISSERLEEQFRYLKEEGFHSYHLSELQSFRKLQHKKNVVITFDDAYLNQLELAYPLLLKYQLKATFFVPVKYIGKTDEWNDPAEPLMTAEQLASMDPAYVAIGYHSYAHRPYDKLSLEQIEIDTQLAQDHMATQPFEVGNYLAYPYGKFPKKKRAKITFKRHLHEAGIQLGLRIGNRLNTFPFKKPYEVQRIDIKGQYSLKTFRSKLKYGKLW